MPGNSEDGNALYILDTSTISEIFRSYYQDRFPSFWARFDEAVLAHAFSSVRSVERELAGARRNEVADSIEHLRSLNRDFFSDPSEEEQNLVREMLNNPALSAANNRWAAKSIRGREDADPFLIAKARAQRELFVRTVVVTQESAANSAGIPAVRQVFGIFCINLQQMMVELGWQF